MQYGDDRRKDSLSIAIADRLTRPKNEAVGQDLGAPNATLAFDNLRVEF